MSITNPIRIPFAQAGSKNEVPDTASTSAKEEMNWTDGFPKIFSTAKNDGGKFLDRKDVNGILFYITSAIKNLQYGELPSFDNNLPASQRYKKDSILFYFSSTRNVLYLIRATSDTNTAPTDSNINGTPWQGYPLISIADNSNIIKGGFELVKDGESELFARGCPTPKNDTDFANRKYVDDKVNSVGDSPFARNTSSGIISAKTASDTLRILGLVVSNLTAESSSLGSITGGLKLTGNSPATGCPNPRDNQPTDFANKKYVDDAITRVNSAISDNVIFSKTNNIIRLAIQSDYLDIQNTILCNSLTVRTGGLRVTGGITLTGTSPATGCPYPRAGQTNDFANKKYVDDEVSKINIFGKTGDVISPLASSGLSIQKNLSVAGSATITGSITANGDASSKNVTATGKATLSGDVELGASGKSLTFKGSVATGCPTPTANSHFANKKYVDDKSIPKFAIPDWSRRTNLSKGSSQEYTPKENGWFFVNGGNHVAVSGKSSDGMPFIIGGTWNYSDYLTVMIPMERNKTFSYSTNGDSSIENICFIPVKYVL